MEVNGSRTSLAVADHSAKPDHGVHRESSYVRRSTQRESSDDSDADRRRSSASRKSRTKSGRSTSASGRRGRRKPIADIQPECRLIFVVSDGCSCPTTVLCITSTCKDQIAFKIKTTSPDAYQVTPHRGVISPGDTVNIVIKYILGDMDSLRCDRFSVVVVKPDVEIQCPTALNKADLWKPDDPCDLSRYMEQRLRSSLIQVCDDARSSSPEPSPPVNSQSACSPCPSQNIEVIANDQPTVACQPSSDEGQATTLEANQCQLRQKLSYTNQMQYIVLFALFVCVLLFVISLYYDSVTKHACSVNYRRSIADSDFSDRIGDHLFS